MRASAAVEVFAFLQHCFTVDFVVLVIQVSCRVCSVLGFLIQSLPLCVSKIWKAVWVYLGKGHRSEKCQM